MGAILFSDEFLPEFQPFRADISFSHSFGPGPISKGLLLAGTAILDADFYHFIFELCREQK